MVLNNGTLSETLARPEGCIKCRSGAHRTQRLIVEHHLVQGHLEATMHRGVNLAAFLLLVGTTHPYPLPLRCEDSAPQGGDCLSLTADC